MSIFNNRLIVIALKLYVCAALVITAILSNPVTSAAAIFALLVYLFFQWRQINIFMGLIVNYFIFFAIAILLAPITNFVISTVISLPVLFLVTNSLIKTSDIVSHRNMKYSHSLTPVGIMLPVIATTNLIAALFLSNWALVISSSIALIYATLLSFISITKISSQSLLTEKIQEHILAGTASELQVILHSKTKIGGKLFIESPYEWLTIQSPVLLFKQDPLILKLSLSPHLSGPSEVSINVYATDIWGLTHAQFQLSVIQLHVIPRARYAAWLAKRYLEATKPGMLPMISNVNTIKPQYGFRRGIEYYGSQLYQPGDELRSIDWKHTSKYNKIITKEFVEFHGQPAVLLVNLAVRDPEEADELAQTIIITAISLARQQIPTVIAVYDQNGVRLVTQTLQPRQMVVQSLKIIDEIMIFENPAQYLYNPNITMLRSNIGRLASIEGESAKVLAQLMGIEYGNFVNSIKYNPATNAIKQALKIANIQSTIVIVSKSNHDANAIEINRFLISKRGYAFVTV